MLQYNLFGEKTQSLVDKYMKDGSMEDIIFNYKTNLFEMSPLSNKGKDDIWLETKITDLNETLLGEGLMTIKR